MYCNYFLCVDNWFVFNECLWEGENMDLIIYCSILFGSVFLVSLPVALFLAAHFDN